MQDDPKSKIDASLDTCARSYISQESGRPFRPVGWIYTEYPAGFDVTNRNVMLTLGIDKVYCVNISVNTDDLHLLPSLTKMARKSILRLAASCLKEACENIELELSGMDVVENA